MSNSTPTFPKLNNYNYKTWSSNMQTWLMSKELWMLVDGEEPCPGDSDKELKLKWKKQAQKAAGELFLSVELDQKSHFHGILSDSVLVWKALRDVHMSQKPGARFNAYDNLFSIRKQPNESLQSLCARIDTSMQMIQDLCPAKFTCGSGPLLRMAVTSLNCFQHFCFLYNSKYLNWICYNSYSHNIFYRDENFRIITAMHSNGPLQQVNW